MNRLKKYASVGVGLMGSLIGLSALAAADEELTNATTAVATSMKENVMASLIAALPVVIIPGLLIIGAFLIWKFGKKFVRG